MSLFPHPRYRNSATRISHPAYRIELILILIALSIAPIDRHLNHAAFFKLTSQHCVTADVLWIFLSVPPVYEHGFFFLADRCIISYNERGSRKWQTGGWSLSYASFPVPSYRIHNIPFIRVQGSKGKKSTWTQCDVNVEKLSEAPRQKIVRVCNNAQYTCAWGSMIANWSESDYQNVENESKKGEFSRGDRKFGEILAYLRKLCNWNYVCT